MPDEWRPLRDEEVAARSSHGEVPFGTYSPGPVQRAVIAVTRRTILRRGIARHQIARLLLSRGAGKLDVYFRGAPFRVGSGNNLIEIGILLRPEYNGREIEFLLMDAPDDAVFVDIGCNVGLFSLPLAVARPNGLVAAIDANPKMIAQLRWNADAGGLSNLRTVQAGVSDAPARGDLLIRRDNEAIVSIRKCDTGAIPLRPLLDILEDMDATRIHGLKIDIEGHEDQALVPFFDKAAPAQLPARVVLETAAGGADYPGCSAALARHGYRLAGRTGNNSMYRRD